MIGMPWSSLMKSAAFSPIIMVGALVFPEVTSGIMEVSTTRSPFVPRTLWIHSLSLEKENWVFPSLTSVCCQRHPSSRKQEPSYNYRRGGKSKKLKFSRNIRNNRLCRKGIACNQILAKKKWEWEEIMRYFFPPPYFIVEFSSYRSHGSRIGYS